jgi:peptidoglycan/LPS O-acetylase OafA/YrhL
LRTKFAYGGPWAAVLWELKGGVAVFFVISGVVLYLPYARAIRDRKPMTEWRTYAWRRAARILPAYWIALTAFAVLDFASGVRGPYFMRYYSLSEIYSSDTVFGGLPVAWSLCVEVTFYALLPLLARWMARVACRAGRSAVTHDAARRGQLGLIALVGFGSIALRAALAGSLTGPVTDDPLVLTTGLPGFLDWFAIGMMLAVIASEWEAGRSPGRAITALAQRPGACLLLALAAFAAGFPAQHGDLFLPWYGLLTHVALGVGSGLLVLAAIGLGRRRRATTGSRRLGGSFLGWLGTISYGIYLWHPVLVQVANNHRERTLAGAGLLWLAVLGGAIVLGAASWYLVERPSQQVLRAYERRARRGSGPGRSPETAVGVQSVTDGLNSAGVAVDHLA